MANLEIYKLWNIFYQLCTIRFLILDLQKKKDVICRNIETHTSGDTSHSSGRDEIWSI